jgi:alkylation response protein AidB-like acyl-CoA dehydrogenase
MDYEFPLEDQEFRAHVRDLIATHMRPEYPMIFVEEAWPLEDAKNFVGVLGEEKLLTLSWPREYGGQEASLWRQTVFREEMWAHNEPRGGQYMALNFIGPAIMKYGTDEQKTRYLPAIAHGDVWWCQGYSEPEAGSDLANVKTRAEKVDGGFQITGQKIWTSFSLVADYNFLAARTTSDGPRQAGLTVFTIPMSREGIEVRSIATMLGPHHLHEVFLTNVFAADDEVLGDVDDGWKIMTSAAIAERTGQPRYARDARILKQIHSYLGDDFQAASSEWKGRYVKALVHQRVAQLLNYRVVAEQIDGELPAFSTPVARISSTQLDQEVADVAMDALGPWALLGHNDENPPLYGHMEHHWRFHQIATIAAGSVEVQKILLSRTM